MVTWVFVCTQDSLTFHVVKIDRRDRLQALSHIFFARLERRDFLESADGQEGANDGLRTKHGGQERKENLYDACKYGLVGV